MGYTVKSAGLDVQGEMEKISRYTRREFAPEELYLFRVALCDNEIDRDGERFTIDALRGLAELYRGKTGILITAGAGRISLREFTIRAWRWTRTGAPPWASRMRG